MKGTHLLNSLRLAGWVAALGFLPAAGAATLVVTNLADDGPGTLRQALTNAASGDLITFATSGTITLTNGELFITNNLTLLGPGATNLAISGNTNSRVFNITNVTVSISGLTVTNGKAPAGISTAGAPGGGIFNAGSLSLSNCHVVANAAGKGGINFKGQRGGSGGGICNVGSISATACAFDGNSAGAGAGVNSSISGAGGNGGAIYNEGTLTLSLCTLYGNAAGNGGIGLIPGACGTGGGIFNAGTLVAIGCTVTGNKGGDEGVVGLGDPIQSSCGGIHNLGTNYSVVLRNTIVAQNVPGAAKYQAEPDISGTPGFPNGSGGTGPTLTNGAFSSQGYNLIGNAGYSVGFTNGLNHDLVGTIDTGSLDPLLRPLADNGGPTPTCALKFGSPAFDAGDDSLNGTDQRGFPRLSGLHVDIGAYESQPWIILQFVSEAQQPDGSALWTFSSSTTNAILTLLAANDLTLPLSNWTVLGPATNIGPGLFQFADPPGTNGPTRFYRVRSP